MKIMRDFSQFEIEAVSRPKEHMVVGESDVLLHQSRSVKVEVNWSRESDGYLLSSILCNVTWPNLARLKYRCVANTHVVKDPCR